MKRLLMASLAVTMVVASSCSSSAKKEEATVAAVAAAAPVAQERVFKIDYDLVDASDKALPEWIKEPTKADKTDERKKNRYFVNESKNANQRLCEKSAEARATAHIASEIAQFMKNTYGEAVQSQSSSDVTEYMEERLAQEAQSFIVGASVVKKYWEKRAYKEALGAEEDKVLFHCFAVVKMSKDNLAKAIEKSKAKLLGEIEDPEVKKTTQKAMAEVGAKFNELEKPVAVEATEEE